MISSSTSSSDTWRGRRVEIVSPGQSELVQGSILVLEVTPAGDAVEARYLAHLLRDIA
jgi:hypothetical protein